MPWKTPKRFALIALTVVLASDLFGQSASVPAAPKNPFNAQVLGFLFPGGGQYYAGATRKGMVYTALTAGSVFIGKAMSTDAEFRSTPTGATLTKDEDKLPLVVGSVIGGVVWLTAAFDAPIDARKANDKRSRVSAIATRSRLGVAVAW